MNSNDEPIEAEIVEEGDNLPAVIKKVESNRSNKPIQVAGNPERDWPQGPVPDRRCRAHKKTGEQCKNAAIQGSTVCRYHGGAARHVKAAAKARIENAADLMAKNLLQLALGAESEQVNLAATNSALDRAGLKAPAEVVLSQGDSKPYEEIFEDIAGNTRAESRRARGIVDDACAESARVPEAYARPAMDEDPRQPRPHREHRTLMPRHITGDTAIEAAAQAQDLDGGHRRYPRP
jgi:hypothetical protein